MSLTVTEVADQLELAARTLRRLPQRKIQGYRGYWPEIIYDAVDVIGWEKEQVRLGPPAPGDIDKMEKALGWMLWLEKDEVKLVWSRANRLRWRKIAPRMGGFSVKHYQNAYKIALFKIVHALANPHLTPSKPYKKLLEK